MNGHRSTADDDAAQEQKSDSSKRADGDRLRVTGSGVLYVENVDDFLASKRVQKTILSVNRSIEVAKRRDGGPHAS